MKRGAGMHVIDVNASFGARVDPSPRFGAPALAADAARHGVACAFAWSAKGLEYDQRAGNDEALAAAAAHPGLRPAGTFDLRDEPGWLHEIRRCRAAGIRLLRIFPGAQRWHIESALFEKALAELSGSDICLAVGSMDCPTGWELPRAAARLTRKAGVRLLLLDVSYQNMAEVIAVMQEFPHVCAETNRLATVDAVGILAREVGADRLLYGSGAPARSMQKALNEILETELPDAAKRAILGGNAARLLGVDPESLVGLPVLESLEPVRFEEELVDVHSHLGHWRLPCRDEEYDPAPMLARMRRFGIRAGIVSSYESMRYDIAAGNRRVAEAIAGHPELMGYVELDPHHLELSCAEMDRWYAHPGFVGCEIELTHIPCPTGSPQVRALMAEVARRGKPVLFMPASGGDALAERGLAREFPGLAIIHAHGAGAEWAAAVKDAPNLHIEYCLSVANPVHIRDGLDILGPERVLFGTDQTLLSVGAMVGLYHDALLTPQERRLVLGGNARRIFGLG